MPMRCIEGSRQHDSTTFAWFLNGSPAALGYLFDFLERGTTVGYGTTVGGCQNV